MNEQNFDKSKQQAPLELEERLRAYYGPQLQEHPLSQSSWQTLQLRLGSQAGTGRRRRFNWRLPRKRSRAYVPTSIQDAFAHIAYEAHVPSTPSMLLCSMKPQDHEAAVRTSWFGRRKIRLILPLNTVVTMEQTELDVLLATGLARSMITHKRIYLLGRFLLAIVAVIAIITIIFAWMHQESLIGFPIALALSIAVAWLLHIQSRSIAFLADTLIVIWLGRKHVCSGLHALANRSRNPRRKLWGEPSLAERIEHVCGTGVESRENQLTLIG